MPNNLIVKDEPQSIGWTMKGNLRVDNVVEDQPDMSVIFMGNLRRATRLEKLEFLFEMVQVALNSPDLTEEPK